MDSRDSSKRKGSHADPSHKLVHNTPSKRRKHLLQEEDAAALLHDLGKSSRSQSPETSSSEKTEDNDSKPISPPSSGSSSPLVVPLSINVNRPHSSSVIGSHQPVSMYNYGIQEMYIPHSYPYMSNTAPPRMCMPTLHGPYPNCTCGSVHHVYNPVGNMPVMETLAHPAQITIGPDSVIHQTLSDSPRKGASKRNKFFYKEVKDHLYSGASTKIGFVNEVFFVMDPKLHVGPINRDGTFEKRVRLHFIEWIELKNPHAHLWLCWGTLLDSNNYPIFRENGSIYRIPGNQSSLFKSNKTFQGWTVADDEQKKTLRDQAILIQKVLEEKWDGNSLESACHCVKQLDIPTNNIPIKELSTQEDFEGLTDPRIIAEQIWSYLGFPDNEVHATQSEESKELLARLLRIRENVEDCLSLFNVLSGNDANTLDFVKLELAVKLFGGPNTMIKNMKNIIETECFNGSMTSEQAKVYLQTKEIGAYLLRYSQNSPDMFCIAFKSESGKVIQYNNISYDIAKDRIRVDNVDYDSWSSLFKARGNLKIPKVSPDYQSLYVGSFEKWIKN